MKTAKEIYPDECWGDYQPMLDEFGKVALQVDDDDYQGDSRVLYQKDSSWGWLQFGWGSCSGCDALQACNSYKEVQDLMNELHKSIKWFGSSSEALGFFLEHDWEGDYSNGDEQKEFVGEVITLLHQKYKSEDKEIR